MGKTYIDDDGYKRFKDSDMKVSRWVASNKLNRDLDDGERVHHINRNKLDDSPGNLWVFKNQEEHEAAHEADGDFDD